MCLLRACISIHSDTVYGDPKIQGLYVGPIFRVFEAMIGTGSCYDVGVLVVLQVEIA